MTVVTNRNIRYIMSVQAYRVRITKRALKEMGRLPQRARRQAEGIIDSLAENPTPEVSKKLTGMESTWRIRLADNYRIMYELDKGELVVLVIKVGPRGGFYR